MCALLRHLEALYCFLNNLLHVPYISGGVVVRPGGVYFIPGLTLFSLTLLSFYLSFVPSWLPMVLKGLNEFAIVAISLTMVSMYVTCFITLSIRYHLFDQIANEMLTLRILDSETLFLELLIILGCCASSLVFVVIIKTIFWSYAGIGADEIIFTLVGVLTSFYNNFVIQMFLHYVRLLGHKFQNINSEVERRIQNNRGDIVLSSVADLTRSHNTVCDTAGKVNTAYNLHVLLVTLEMFVRTTLNLFLLIQRAYHFDMNFMFTYVCSVHTNQVHPVHVVLQPRGRRGRDSQGLY